MTVVAAVLTVVAVTLWRPPSRWLVAVRLGVDVARPVRTRRWAVAPVAGGVIALAVVVDVALPDAIVVSTGVGVAAFVIRRVHTDRRDRAAHRRRDAVAAAVGLMAAELRAGLLPHRVLKGLAEEFPFLSAAARTAQAGHDVPAALTVASAEPGAAALSDVAGAWQVAARSGAPLAHVLDRVEQRMRADHDVDRDIQGHLAPARATGRVMALLPVLGLALGSGLGGHPLEVLTTTTPGALCLAAGATLACVGVAWVDRIARDAEGRP